METPLTSFKPQPIGAQVRQLVDQCARQAEQQLSELRQRGYGGHLGTLLTGCSQQKGGRRG